MENNVKMRCIFPEGYNDTILKRKIKFGEEYYVDTKRAETLKKSKVAEEIKENTEVKSRTRRKYVEK